MGITEKDCIQALQKAAEQLRKSPTKPEYEALGIRPSSTSILRIVGSWNSAKKQAGLETYDNTSSGGQPTQPKPEWVDLPETYVWEETTSQQRWYYKNREHQIEVKNKRKKKLRRWLFELKRNQYSCDLCSEGNPACIDFHHIDEKKDDISRMVNFGYSRDTILSEIEKCVPLCANCHQKHHNGNSNKDNEYGEMNEQSEIIGHFPRKSNYSKIEYRKQLRSWLGSYKKSVGGCNRCPEDQPVCLEFHHFNPDEKTISISTLMVHNPSKDLLMSEIQLCTILCRNCHRKEHYSIPAPSS